VDLRSSRTAGQVLGVPALPPGPVAAAADRARAALGRLHAAMAPPPLRVLEGLFGILEHRVLVALCEAGVPDALRAPVAVPVLAAELDVDPEALDRLCRFAATRGWVRIDRRGRVRPTRVTAFLRRDHPGGWRGWVDFAGGDDVVAAVGALTAGRQAGADPFAAANGAPFFDWMAARPERGAAFDRAMAAGGRMHGLTLAAALDWPSASNVCDVGGGTSHLLATLADLVPGLEGTVLDLPAVVDRAVDHPRVRAVAGDAFAAVPAGFDTYLLVNVVHDWSDDDATRILSRVAESARGAGGAGARVVVVEAERTAVPRDGVAAAADVLMAALTPGGRERSAAEVSAIGRAAGLVPDRSVRLASGDLAHVLYPA
jgi:hypothetical protein